jgi:UDP-N-acetylmuramoyl-L-alanyl-D-glutamate--2,6-diaminopimelate ligase
VSSPRPEHVRERLLSELGALVGARVDGPDLPVRGVSLSSGDVVAGDLYAALPGANAHGAWFARDAVRAGAVAVLTDAAGAQLLDEAGTSVPRLVVQQPRAVVGRLAAAVYGTTDLPVRMVGITGTNGKTTTAYLVSSALEALGHSTGLIGTVETRIGPDRVRSARTTPEATVLHALLAVMAERGVDTCVMEVSSHALAQHRVDGVVYEVALFTNLSQDHLDFHPTMRDYFLTKASLFTPERARQGVVCVDDEWGVELAALASVPVVTVSATGHPADYRVDVDAADPAAFTVDGPGVRLALRSALPGAFNVVNTAMAALALLCLGTDQADVERALAADPHVPGRMERVTVEGSDDLPLVVVDYAHTPDAVAAALRALRPATTGRLVVVLGAGGDRDRGKRAAMGRAAAEHADEVFVTDDNPRSEDPAAIRAAILEGARSAGTPAVLHDVAGRGSAIRAAVARGHAAGPGSVVAVVGKGHETGQEVAGTVHPFDDRDEAAAALRSTTAGGPQ